MFFNDEKVCVVTLVHLHVFVSAHLMSHFIKIRM